MHLEEATFVCLLQRSRVLWGNLEMGSMGPFAAMSKRTDTRCFCNKLILFPFENTSIRFVVVVVLSILLLLLIQNSKSFPPPSILLHYFSRIIKTNFTRVGWDFPENYHSRPFPGMKFFAKKRNSREYRDWPIIFPVFPFPGMENFREITNPKLHNYRNCWSKTKKVKVANFEIG